MTRSILVLILILAACQPTSTEVPVIDLSNPSGSRTLHLNEIADEFRVVQLETKPECLIPQYYRLLITSKYFVIIGREAVLQFDSEGQFIRTLARQGKGPGEFTDIGAHGITPDESELIFFHWGDREHLTGYNLDTGKLSMRIPLPKEYISDLLLLDDHILCISSKFDPLELFTMDFEGNALDSIG